MRRRRSAMALGWFAAAALVWAMLANHTPAVAGGTSPTFRTGPICAKGAAYETCCCAPRQFLPHTSTYTAGTTTKTVARTATTTLTLYSSTRTITSTSTLGSKAAREALPVGRAGEDTEGDSAALSVSLGDASLEPEDDGSRLFKRHLCPLCPTNAFLRTNGNAPYCCPPRKILVKTVRKTRTKVVIVKTATATVKAVKTVTKLALFQAVQGRLYYDVDASGTYTPGVDTPYSFLPIVLSINSPTTSALSRRGLAIVARSTTGADGSYNFPPVAVSSGDNVTVASTNGTSLQTTTVGNDSVVGSLSAPVSGASTTTVFATKSVVPSKVTTNGAGLTTTAPLAARTSTVSPPAGQSSTKKTTVMLGASTLNPASTTQKNLPTTSISQPGVGSSSATPLGGTPLTKRTTTAGAGPDTTTAAAQPVTSTTKAAETTTSTLEAETQTQTSSTASATQTLTTSSFSETSTSETKRTTSTSETTTKTNTPTYTAADPNFGSNVLRVGPDNPLAEVVAIGASGSTNPADTDLTQFDGNHPPAGLYELVTTYSGGAYTYQNDEDRWDKSIGGVSTWGLGDPSDYGYLVVDLTMTRKINRFSVFQTYADGKLTSIVFHRHMRLNDTPPDVLDDGWAEVAPEADVGKGRNYGGILVGPTKIAVTPFVTRYLRIGVRNNGTYGDASYIELQGIKAFGDNKPDTTIENPTTSNVLRGGPPNTNPIAEIVEISQGPEGATVTPFNSDLLALDGNAPSSVLYEVGYLDDEDKWGNTVGGVATWNAGDPADYGYLVVDMKVPRNISRFSVFQAFNDGKTTSVVFHKHVELGYDAPLANDAGWTQIADEAWMGTQNQGPDYITNPTKVVVSPSIVTRFLRIGVRNNGTLGDAGYIEFSGVKAFQ